MRVLRKRSGHSAIEFALIMPVFLTVITGMMEWGWVFFQRSTVVEAVRTGCREGASVHPDDVPGPVETAEESMEDYLDSYGIQCGEGSGTSCESDVQITGEWPSMTLSCNLVVGYDPLIDLVPVPTEMFAASIMLVEQKQ